MKVSTLILSLSVVVAAQSAFAGGGGGSGGRGSNGPARDYKDINMGNSRFDRAAKGYMSKGMPEYEARQRAARDINNAGRSNSTNGPSRHDRSDGYGMGGSSQR